MTGFDDLVGAPDGVSGETRIAARAGNIWMRRVTALFIDVLPLIAIAEIILLMAGYRSALSDGYKPSGITGDTIDLLALGIYYPIIMRVTDGQTLGKRLTNLRVICTDGRPMRGYRAAWREMIVKPALSSTLIAAPKGRDIWPASDSS
jgi:uncharacterized RDD family membrane protein YckC